MRLPESVEIEGRITESIHIGGVFASAKPAIVRTLLGSCIAVCLRDPVARVGGMNHFMLPDGISGSILPSSYGVNAMELLINKCMSLGADRRRLEAKVFGGGHVLRLESDQRTVPKQNISFAKSFLITEGIPVVAHSVGGHAAREVYFFTDSGRILLRRLQPTGLDSRKIKEITPVAPAPIVQSDDENVTLF